MSTVSHCSDWCAPLFSKRAAQICQTVEWQGIASPKAGDSMSYSVPTRPVETRKIELFHTKFQRSKRSWSKQQQEEWLDDAMESSSQHLEIIPNSRASRALLPRLPLGLFWAELPVTFLNSPTHLLTTVAKLFRLTAAYRLLQPCREPRLQKFR